MRSAQLVSASSVALPVAGLASRGLELRELRYFHTVARTGNFGRAARELNIAQPTVTHQVQKLEEGLGTQLLIRHGRGVTLTEAGASLLARVDIIMNLLSAPLEEAATPERTTGTLTLGLTAECAPLLVPPLLAQCRARWPHLTLLVRESDTATLEEWVLGGRVDVAVLQDPPALDALAIEPVLSERLGLVVGAQSPLAEAGGPVRPRDLSGLAMILPPPRHWIRRRVENAWFRRGVRMGSLQQVDSVTVTKEMVRSGLGCTVLPCAAVQDELARGSLVFRPIEQMPLFAVHAIVRRNGLAAMPLLTEFCRRLRESMTALAQDGCWSGASIAEHGEGAIEPELAMAAGD